jgi:hypothetical protein
MLTFQLKRLNDRLNALETCLLTMTELRGYLRKAEQHRCYFLCICLTHNKYNEEISQIDSFLTYLFAEEERIRNEKNELLLSVKK